MELIRTTRLHPHYFFGLDLGQRHDPAALAVLLRTCEPLPYCDPVSQNIPHELLFHLRHAERWRLSTGYTAIVEDVRRLMRDTSGRIFGSWAVQPGHQANPLKTLVVDATGVGQPVVEMLRNSELNANIIPITITGGARSHQMR